MSYSKNGFLATGTGSGGGSSVGGAAITIPSPIAIPAPVTGNGWVLGGTASVDATNLYCNSATTGTQGWAYYPSSVTMDGLYLCFDALLGIDAFHIFLCDPAQVTTTTNPFGSNNKGLDIFWESYYTATRPSPNNAAGTGGYGQINYYGTANANQSSTVSVSYADSTINLSANNTQYGPMRTEIYLRATGITDLYHVQVYKNGATVMEAVMPGPPGGKALLAFGGQTGGLQGVNTVRNFKGFQGTYETVPATLGINYASASVGMPQGTRVRQYTFTSDTQSFTIDSGSLSQNSGRLIVTGVTSPSGNHSALEPNTATSVADGELVVDYQGVTPMTSNYIDGGLIFRATDANNHYMVTLRLGTNNGTFTAQRPYELYKKVGGTYTSLNGPIEQGTYENRWPYLDATAPVRAMVRFVGSSISLYLNESFVASWVDATYSTGLVGVRLASSGSGVAPVASADNITVYTLNNPWTPYDYSPQGTAGLPLIGTPETVTTANTGAAYTIQDPLTSSVANLTLTANATLTFPTLAAGKSFTVALTQDATGSRTVTWPGTVKWAGGAAPTLTTSATKTDLFTFLSLDGVSWLGFLGGKNF